jgi:hypothetical protein
VPNTEEINILLKSEVWKQKKSNKRNKPFQVHHARWIISVRPQSMAAIEYGVEEVILSLYRADGFADSMKSKQWIERDICQAENILYFQNKTFFLKTCE